MVQLQAFRDSKAISNFQGNKTKARLVTNNDGSLADNAMKYIYLQVYMLYVSIAYMYVYIRWLCLGARIFFLLPIRKPI